MRGKRALTDLTDNTIGGGCKMSKMDERILVVDRGYLFEDEALTFQGLLTDPVKFKHIMKKFNNYFEVRRGDAEVNFEWKQPIPYTIIRRGKEVFVYKRLSGGGEVRLHDQLSIGVGGHMNKINDIRNWNDNLKINMFREIGEELRIDTPLFSDPTIVGIVNDEENEVGRVHICILAVIDLPEDAEVEVQETEQLEGYWIRTKDLTKAGLFESLESWSQIAAGIL